MSSYKFAVQHTGHPFGPSEQITEDDWQELSQHTSLSAACKRVQKHKGAMSEALGQNAWDDHFRIVPLQDTSYTVELGCLGVIDRHGRTRPCEKHRHDEVSLPWAKGMSRPRLGENGLPQGWATNYQCDECAEKEAQERAIQYGLA
jgi:hypothetical protein